jgi:short-subunit dehydrogenase
MKVQSKTILVTGAGNGIGRELALQLLAKGARVAAIDLNPAALNETSKLAGNKQPALSLHATDITNRQAVETLPEQIMAHHGSIDGIINCAGIIQPFVRVNKLDYAVIERVMNVNFYGTLYITKTLLPHLLQRPEAHIVNISSMGGFLPVPGQSIYGASKAAVKLLTEALYSELADTNVRVTVVFPGGVETNIAANSGLGNALSKDDTSNSSYKMLTPAKAAQIIIDGMEANRFRVIAGSDSSFMDKLYRLHPKFAANFIYKQMKNLLNE